ncbi:MAG: folate family ECF transporter S component [Clostridia bacterium]|nr:folate family ECF transporter S component [Clostridia bacterium]
MSDNQNEQIIVESSTEQENVDNNVLESNADELINQEEKTAKKKNKKIFTVKMISYTAMFAALSVITNIFTININIGGSNAISLTYTICFLAGALLGPIQGLVVGLIGDLLGFLIHPSGVFNPIITVSTGLIGLLSGLVFLLLRKMDFKFSLIVKTIISFILILGICTSLNTIGIWVYVLSSKYTLPAYFALRTVKQLPFWAINLGICIALIYPLTKISNLFLKKPKISKRDFV